MNPIRREVLNGLFVLVISTLLSAAIAAFEIKFNLQVWLLIVIGVAVAVSGYVMFELTLRYMASTAESMRQREEEWLKRVGTPARLDLGFSLGSAGTSSMAAEVKSIKPGNDLTIMFNFGPGGGRESKATSEGREQLYGAIMAQLKRGTIREYKRLICYDHEVLSADSDLKSGILRVGEGPGTIDRQMAEHCRVMMETKGCSVYVAPSILRNVVTLYGTDKVSMTVEAVDRATGNREVIGVLIFYDPPNGDIVERFGQMERETERRMVAVHKIRFPEDVETTEKLATRSPTAR